MKNLINDNLMSEIATYMNEKIREKLHSELAPCTNDTFLHEYLKIDNNLLIMDLLHYHGIYNFD
mgnify:CR=1 FL=1